LSELKQVKYIFLVGKYKPSKFQYFIETLYDEFPLTQVQYIKDDLPENEIGVMMKHKEQLMIGDPDYFICLRYNLCSSFPLAEMFDFFMKLEKEAAEEPERNKPLLCLAGIPAKDAADFHGAKILSKPESKEIIYYTEKTTTEGSSSQVETINCGIYLFSTSFYGPLDEADVME
jgi:hypothetical protein